MAFPLGINCQDCHHAWICFRGGRKYDFMVSGERFSSKSTQNLPLVPDWVVGRVYLPSSRATHYHVRFLHSQRHSGHLDFQKGDHDFPIIVYYALRVREDINGKKRFLSGIARNMGGVYPCPDLLAPFFTK